MAKSDSKILQNEIKKLLDAMLGGNVKKAKKPNNRITPHAVTGPLSTMKILMIDIETSPHELLGFGLFNQNFGIDSIKKASEVICYAAEWMHETNNVMFDSVNESTPEEMMSGLWKLVDEADAICHYNGRSFDMKKILGSFMMCGLKPPRPYKNIDLLDVVRKTDGYASKKLDWIAQVINGDRKLSHAGIDLWKRCGEGDQKAWKTMKKYNIKDTALLRGLYWKYLPYMDKHPNHAVFMVRAGITLRSPICPNCGSDDLRTNGIIALSTQMYELDTCNNCGTHIRGRSTIVPKESRKFIRTQTTNG